MQSYIKLFVIILVCLTSASFAQEATPTPEDTSATMGDTAEMEDVSFPYLAEITGDNLYIRSGPGTNFYRCGKLNKGEQVRVVGKQFSWARIVPPEGSFSWIYSQYVDVDPKVPKVGVVTGDNVRVYAGSDFIRPLYSKKLQGRLNKGDKVEVLGGPLEDYYKITPPPFAYLWVSANYTKLIKKVEETQMAIGTEVAGSETGAEKVVEEVVKKPVSPEELLEAYQILEKKVDAERAEPIDQQSYTDLKKALTEIADNEAAGKAARYAEFLLGQIDAFELAASVAQEVKLQEELLADVKEKINKAQETRLKEFKNLGEFDVVGRLQTFATYGPGHYRIVDGTGKTICYALPAAGASGTNLSRLVGKKVGLVGTVEPHKETASALIKFKQIAQLD